MTFAYALAIVLNIIYIILVYYIIFEISRALHRRGTIWLISFLIFLSPFVSILVLADSLVGLMWVVLLTPFLAVATLMIFFTKWMLLYYGVAYGILAVSYYLLKHRRSADKSKENSRAQLRSGDQNIRKKREGQARALRWFVLSRASNFVAATGTKLPVTSYLKPTFSTYHHTCHSRHYSNLTPHQTIANKNFRFPYARAG